jgi:hypothetical protein
MVPTIIARLKRDGNFASYCIDKLHNGQTSDHKASLPRLLVASIGLNDKIKEVCEKLYAEQCAIGQLSESGLDVIAGQIRPVAHSLLDVLVPTTY